MQRLICFCLLVICFAALLSACAPAAREATSGGVVGEITAEVSTVEPSLSTPLPPDTTPPPTDVSPTQTPIPPLPGGLSPTELKYRVLAEFPDFFFCDPDYYPIARDDEMNLARQRFPDLQNHAEEFQTILAHNHLTGLATFTDDQRLLIYREHKKLNAIPFEQTGTEYQFQIQVEKTEGEGEVIHGQIDGQGRIDVLQRSPSIPTCPICLAAGTLIDTPAGPVPVERLRVGMPVWTVDRTGVRVAQPLLLVTRTVAPAAHRVIHLALTDGRELWVSPGHPLGDGHRAEQLQAGDLLDGAQILSVERVPYSDSATYDLLPDGDTGRYWANGILIASTLNEAAYSDSECSLIVVISSRFFLERC